MGSQSGISGFIKAAQFQICTQSHRGDIYSSLLKDQICRLLPSFLEALRVASGKMGHRDPTGLDFTHDWTQDTIVWKMEFELNLSL